ncbi:hypothetical protein IGI04_003507 [Brassica rapa subsp. trilocularis]|uniref:Uncharacterized protein n=1 Tax=Brassica rapa subsp. trilocularis TaxID=1813537 RepID=A0ABQ7NYN7_BRACM|nr:hypothetical protein IGI04_003507 [Brassica rapa subsp. trilocularis]
MKSLHLSLSTTQRDEESLQTSLAGGALLFEIKGRWPEQETKVDEEASAKQRIAFSGAIQDDLALKERLSKIKLLETLIARQEELKDYEKDLKKSLVNELMPKSRVKNKPKQSRVKNKPEQFHVTDFCITAIL